QSEPEGERPEGTPVFLSAHPVDRGRLLLEGYDLLRVLGRRTARPLFLLTVPVITPLAEIPSIPHCPDLTARHVSERQERDCDHQGPKMYSQPEGTVGADREPKCRPEQDRGD